MCLCKRPWKLGSITDLLSMTFNYSLLFLDCNNRNNCFCSLTQIHYRRSISISGFLNSIILHFLRNILFFYEWIRSTEHAKLSLSSWKDLFSVILELKGQGCGRSFNVCKTFLKTTTQFTRILSRLEKMNVS